MKVKFSSKKILFFTFLIFLVTNIIAVFVVFKDYRNQNKNSKLSSNAKLKYKNVKDKIERFELNKDSSLLLKYDLIIEETKSLDSILKSTIVEKNTFDSLKEKLVNFIDKENVASN